MSEPGPVDTIRAAFVDELVAEEAVAALNRWFRWILHPDDEPVPDVFADFGLDSAEYAWGMDDVDWQLGPHARAIGSDVSIVLETHDTWQRLSGLLKALGAITVTVSRDAT